MRNRMSLWRDLLVTALFFVFVVLILRTLDERADTRFTGSVHVIDGDTLVLSSQRLRLAGIDAPELHQTCQRGTQIWPCGIEARGVLMGLVAGHAVDCAGDSRDRYGRFLVVCSAAGRTLNSAMVEDGFAVSADGYGQEEARARKARRGLWSGMFDMPRDWRRTHGAVDETAATPISVIRFYLDPLVKRFREMVTGAME